MDARKHDAIPAVQLEASTPSSTTPPAPTLTSRPVGGRRHHIVWLGSQLDVEMDSSAATRTLLELEAMIRDDSSLVHAIRSGGVLPKIEAMQDHRSDTVYERAASILLESFAGRYEDEI